MPNYTSVILNIGGSTSPTSDNAIGFCKPMFNDIFLISCESVSSAGKITYYGDIINLGIWKKLNLNFGSPSLQNTIIVCIGDSLTYGAGGGSSSGASSPGNNWPDAWASLAGYTIYNCGVSGDTSGQMLARFNTDVIAYSPDYCIIECGLNDFLQGVPLATCENNILSMVNLCLANNIQPRFVHYIQRNNQMQLAINAGAYTFNPASMAQYLDDVWTYIQSLGYPCVLLNDFTDINSNNADMNYFYNAMNDYIHPSANGYKQWASGIHVSFIDISSSSLNNNVYTLYSGWEYKYYLGQQRFVIIDNNGNIVLDNSNVDTISKFPIDFTVHKSHQFEIITGDASSEGIFYIPTKLLEKVFGESPEVNNGHIPVINNVYMPNYFKPKNLSNNLYKVEPLCKDSYIEHDVIPEYTLSKYPSIIGGVQGNIGVDFDNKSRFTEQVYEDNFIPFCAVRNPVTFKAQVTNCRLVLAILGLTMYSMLEPILRPGETQNNRPIYEPWLIWGVFRFLGNHEYGGGGPGYPWDDVDSPKIDVLGDLSPNWSY